MGQDNTIANMNESGVILPREKQRYFLLNINEPKDNNDDKERKNNVDVWIKKGIAPIFYGKWTRKQICNKEALKNKEDKSNQEEKLTKKQWDDAHLFLKTFHNISDDNIVFSIGNDNIFFFQQKDKLDEKFFDSKKDLVKYFEIKNTTVIPIKKCPLVLASIKASRKFSSGTFKELDKKKDFGNIQAIRYKLYDKKAAISNFPEYLKCLSSVEFETLIAKILEEKGLFVPAYKGGFIKNFDLVCRNCGEDSIEIGKNIIKPYEPKLIQIKLKLKKDYEIKDDYLYFCIDSKMDDKKNVFDADCIKNTLLNDQKTSEWLKKSLFWADNAVLR